MIKKYKIKKNAISKDLANYLFNYIVLKKDVLKTYMDHQRISPFNEQRNRIKTNSYVLIR